MARRDTLGDRGLLSKNYVVVHEDATVAEAVAFVLETDLETHACYVVDAEGRLTGLLPLRTMLGAPPTAKVAALAQKNVVALRSDASQAVVEDFFFTYRLLSFPVIDENGLLVGAVLGDDLADSYAEVLDREFEGRVKASALARLALPPEAAKLSAVRRARSSWTMFHVAAAAALGGAGAFLWQLEPAATLCLAPAAVLSAGAAQRAAVMAASEATELNRGREVLSSLIIGLVAGLLTAGITLSPLSSASAAVCALTVGFASPIGASLGSSLPAGLEELGGENARYAALVSVTLAVSLTAAFAAAIGVLLLR